MTLEIQGRGHESYALLKCFSSCVVPEVNTHLITNNS